MRIHRDKAAGIAWEVCDHRSDGTRKGYDMLETQPPAPRGAGHDCFPLPTTSLEQIVVGYDGSAAGRDALALAERPARTAGSKLLIARVEGNLAEPERARVEAELARDIEAALAESPLSPAVRLLSGRRGRCMS